VYAIAGARYDEGIASADPVRTAFRGFLLDIALNAAVPLLLYRLSKRWVSASEFTALAIATTFPLGKSAFDIARHRKLDPVSVIVLLALAANGIAVLFGGTPRLLLVRESFFTGAFGLACFASLVLPRPLMFHIGEHFLAGGDALKSRRYRISWELPEVRFTSRLITSVWGSVFLGEFAIHLLLIFRLPVAWVLVISPILLGSVTIATIVWTFRYAKRARERALPKVDDLMRRQPG
jgi:hypothetical protein